MKLWEWLIFAFLVLMLSIPVSMCLSEGSKNNSNKEEEIYGLYFKQRGKCFHFYYKRPTEIPCTKRIEELIKQ